MKSKLGLLAVSFFLLSFSAFGTPEFETKFSIRVSENVSRNFTVSYEKQFLSLSAQDVTSNEKGEAINISNVLPKIGLHNAQVVMLSNERTFVVAEDKIFGQFYLYLNADLKTGFTRVSLREEPSSANIFGAFVITK